MKATRYHLLALVILSFLPHKALSISHDDFEIDAHRARSATLKISDQAINIYDQGHITLQRPDEIRNANFATIKQRNNSFTGLKVIIDAETDKGIYSTRSAVWINNSELVQFDLNSGIVTGGYLDGNVINLTDAKGSNNINIAALGSVSNESTSGGHTINYVGSNDSDLTINLTGSASGIGTISNSASDSDSKVVYFDNATSTLTIANDGGLISATDSTNNAIEIINSGLINITNGGSDVDASIIGSIINSGSGEFRLNNNDNSTINGDVTLGSNASSLVNINDGSITGDINFGNASQKLSLFNDAEFEGTINGAGSVFLDGRDVSLKLNSTTLNAAINGSSTSSSSAGNIVILDNQSVVTNVDIGTLNSIYLTSLNSGSTLDLATNNNALTSQIEMAVNSTLKIGDSLVSGNISSIITGSNFGQIQFTQNNSLGGDITDISSVVISSGKTINTGSYDISASNLTIGSNANLNLGSNSNISGLIDGSSSNSGSINITGSDSSFNSAIGSSNALSQINISSSGSATFNANIAANNIDFAGRVNLSNASGNVITGNLTGSGNGVLNLGSASHQLNGNLTLASGNSLAVEIDSNNNHGSIISSGLVNVSSGSLLNLTVANDVVQSGSSYELITGGSGSAISNISNSNIIINDITRSSFNNFRFSTTVSDNSLFLNISNSSILGKTPSQRNLYSELIDINDASGKLLELQNVLNSASDQNLAADILGSAGVQDDSSSHRLSFSNTNDSLNLASQRLAGLRGFSSGNSSFKDSVWGQTFGTKVSQGSNSTSQGYEALSHGFAFGIDHEVREDVVFGLSVSYANSSTRSLDKFKKTDLDTYQINLYGSKNYENIFINSMIGLAYNQYHSYRQIDAVGATATAKYSGQTYIAKVEVGHDFKLVDEFIFTPTFAITAAKNRINDYDENGAGTLNLAIDNKDSSFFELRAGTAISKDYRLSRYKKLRPNFSLSYGYDFVGSKQKVNSRFVGQSSSFSSVSAGMPQGSLKVGTGLRVFYKDEFTIDFDYSFDYRHDYRAHSGSLKGKYEF